MKSFTLTSLARELEISAKRARSIMRSSGQVRPGPRWVFPLDRKAEIKALLKPKKKAPAKRGHKDNELRMAA